MPYCRWTHTLKHVLHMWILMSALGCIQVIVQSGLPDFTWVYTHRMEVVTLLHSLNTNGSCVHTRIHTHKKRIYTHKPSMLLTRTSTQQRGSGVFSFDPAHAILVSHTVSQTPSIIHMHTQAQIYTFSHAILSFFSSDTHIHFFSFFHTGTHKCTHTQINTRTHCHNDPSHWHWRSVCLISSAGGKKTRWPWPSLTKNMSHATLASLV